MPVLAALVLDTPTLQDALARMHGAIAPIRDELNAADRELGDGDTGMTVEQLVSVWHAAAPSLPPDVGEALRKLAQETRRASGSSLASVMAIALGAAGKAASGNTALDRDAVIAALAAAATAISARSGASPGDKTVLDTFLHIADGLLAGRGAVEAADAALVEFRGRQSRLGRARMYGERTVGHDDPGMLAAARLLHATRRS